MEQTKAKLRETLLKLCLFYEQHIDDQKGTTQEDLRARFDLELDRTVEEIFTLLGVS